MLIYLHIVFCCCPASIVLLNTCDGNHMDHKDSHFPPSHSPDCYQSSPSKSYNSHCWFSAWNLSESPLLTSYLDLVRNPEPSNPQSPLPVMSSTRRCVWKLCGPERLCTRSVIASASAGFIFPHIAGHWEDFGHFWFEGTRAEKRLIPTTPEASGEN